mgnify:CR=1 FL=1
MQTVIVRFLARTLMFLSKSSYAPALLQVSARESRRLSRPSIAGGGGGGLSSKRFSSDTSAGSDWEGRPPSQPSATCRRSVCPDVSPHPGRRPATIGGSWLCDGGSPRAAEARRSADRGEAVKRRRIASGIESPRAQPHRRVPDLQPRFRTHPVDRVIAARASGVAGGRALRGGRHRKPSPAITAACVQSYTRG